MSESFETFDVVELYADEPLDETEAVRVTATSAAAAAVQCVKDMGWEQPAAAVVAVRRADSQDAWVSYRVRSRLHREYSVERVAEAGV
jgi:uncharacterized protein YqeY